MILFSINIWLHKQRCYKNNNKKAPAEIQDAIGIFKTLISKVKGVICLSQTDLSITFALLPLHLLITKNISGKINRIMDN